MAKEKSIIVVDDEEDIREIFVDILSNLNIKILDAKDGKEALNKIKKNNVILVVSDLNMPVMDGLELLYEVRDTLKSQIPFIFTSAYTDNLENRNMQLVNVSFLKKPFSNEALLDRVNETIFIG